jgi:hypothetical protein
VLLFMVQKHGTYKKWREDRKFIWNMVLEKNIEKTMDR